MQLQELFIIIWLILWLHRFFITSVIIIITVATFFYGRHYSYHHYVFKTYFNITDNFNIIIIS